MIAEADGALDQGAASFLELLTDPELDTVFFDCVLSQDTGEAHTCIFEQPMHGPPVSFPPGCAQWPQRAAV